MKRTDNAEEVCGVDGEDLLGRAIVISRDAVQQGRHLSKLN